MKHHILIIDDEEYLVGLTQQLLEKQGYSVETALSGGEGVRKIKQAPEKYTVVLLDYAMPGKNGAETAREILAITQHIQILIYSGDSSRDAVLNTFRAGAVEFIEKDNAEELLEAVRSCCKKFDETHRTVTTEPSDSDHARIIRSVGMFGESPALAGISQQILKYRPLQVPIHIVGETGTGKEIIAQALHVGDRSLFHAINCGKFSDGSNLLESELFGYERGAFTGAIQSKAGLFEIASGGTIFLDEVHHLSLSAQTKLLRVLQEWKIRRISGAREIPVKFRLITAAKPEIEQAIRDGRFLPDLYQRLLVLRIDVPPLRERFEDIPSLVAIFTDRFCKQYGTQQKFLAKTVEYFKNCDWKDGNIRELEHTVQRILANHPEVERIEPVHLERKFFKSMEKPYGSYEAIKDEVENFERSLFQSLLKSASSKSGLARTLGMSITTLSSRLKKLGLDQPGSSVEESIIYGLPQGKEGESQMIHVVEESI